LRAAAATSFDGETTNTGTESDVTTADGTLTLHPGNDSESTWVEVQSDSGDVELVIEPAQQGLDTEIYSNSSAETTNDTEGHYAWNVTHDELEDIPRDTDGADVVFKVYENGEVNATSGTYTLDQSHLDSPKAVMWVTDNSGTDNATQTDMIADSLSNETEERFLRSDKTIHSYSSFINVHPNASETEIHLVNQSVRDNYDSQAESLDDGSLLRLQTMNVNSGPVLMYTAGVEDAPETSYTTYDDAEGVVTLQHGDGLDDVEQLHVSSTVGESYDFGTALDHFDWRTAFNLSWFGALSPMLLLPFATGRR